MLPKKITLRNFMSYGDDPVELDFTGMHVACLSGDNGNGKSALLDAMTYALWGKTRASASQAAGEVDLVRLGADDMEVRFEFDLEGSRYRVTRKRNRARATGEWQVALQTPDGDWTPVGGTGKAETGRHLSSLLRMEHETFLNSAYLQQGRADEFTRQKPADRKRILGEVMDLRRYDRLTEMARVRKGNSDLHRAELDGEIRSLEASIDREGEFRDHLKRHEEDLARWTETAANLAGELEKLRGREAILEQQAARLHEHEEALRLAEEQKEDMLRDEAALQARAEEYRRCLAESVRIEAERRELHEVRNRLATLERDLAGVHEARQREQALLGEIRLQKQRLESELAEWERECRLADERAQTIDSLAREIARKEPEHEAMARDESALAARAEELNAAQEEFAGLASENKRIKYDIEEVQEVLALLKGPKSTCPVCESDLRGGRQEAVVLRQETRLAGLQGRLQDLGREGMECKRRRDALQAQAASLEQRLRGAAALRAQIETLKTRRTEEIGKQQAAAGASEKRALARERLDRGEYAKSERAELEGLQEVIAGLRGVEEACAAARQRARALESNGVEASVARLEDARRSLQPCEEQLARRRQGIASLTEQIARLAESAAELKSALAGYETVRAAAQEAAVSHREATEAAAAARAQKDRCDHAIAEIAALREQLKAKTEMRAGVIRDREAYEELARAFGQKGLQAHIIENILPEIELEANRLLTRMTDNALRVQLETQRERRTGGGATETLDIRITDDMGTRPYEMFSGGEAFRVNFALRIALSRLLARRAGASLRTLILDEGFGTQDARGRERLVEAIESVRDEFDLILVISHMEDLKDAFPTRIEVTKTPSGSRIALLD